MLQAQSERCEKKLAIHLEEMNNAGKAEEARICGELLTANLYRIRRGDEKAYVDNYYDPQGAQKVIALDVRLSPGQNAQRYYKKYQKLNEARKHARQQAELARAELEFAKKFPSKDPWAMLLSAVSKHPLRAPQNPTSRTEPAIYSTTTDSIPISPETMPAPSIPLTFGSSLTTLTSAGDLSPVVITILQDR